MKLQDAEAVMHDEMGRWVSAERQGNAIYIGSSWGRLAIGCRGCVKAFRMNKRMNDENQRRAIVDWVQRHISCHPKW